MTGAPAESPAAPMFSRRQWLALAAASAAAPAPLAAQAPFVPTPDPVIQAMLDLAAVRRGERLVDLGCGDGRIVLAAARRGAVARGIDNDAELIDRARRRAELEGLGANARFETGDLFDARVRDADIVTLYLLSSMNARLRPKLMTELRAGARIVSHAFDMGDWPPDAMRVAEEKNVFLWIVPAVVGGDWQLRLGDGSAGLLTFEQRFQRIAGQFRGAALSGVDLDGARLSFRLGGLLFAGRVGDRTIEPDPDGPAEAEAGWQASRIA